MIDADPNQHLQAWSSLGAHDRVDVVGGAYEENILERIRGRRRGPTSSWSIWRVRPTTAAYAVSKADLVIVPAQPSRMDLQEAYRAAALVEGRGGRVGDFLSDRTFQTSVLATRAATARQLEQSGIPVFDTEFLERTAFREISFHGHPRVTPDSNAARMSEVCRSR